MSVLNQMLRDLESRGVGTEVAADESEPNEAAVTPIVRRLARPQARPTHSVRFIRAAVWTATGAIVVATLGGHFWYVRHLNEYARAPQPLGAVQFAALIAGQPTAAQAPRNATQTAVAARTDDRAGATTANAPAEEVSRPPSTSDKPRLVVAAAPTSAARAPAAAATPKRGPAKSGLDDATGVPRAAAAPAERSPAPPSTAAAPGSARSEAAAIISRPSNPTAALEARAAELIARGRSNEAMALLAQVLQQAPGHSGARATLAALQAESGRRDLALQTLLAGSEVEPVRFAAAAAQLQVEFGQADAALATLARVPVPARTAAHEALAGGIAQRAGEHERAIEAYQRALRAPNAPALWWTGLAISLDAVNQVEAALEAYRRANADPALPASAREYARSRIDALSIVAAGNPTTAIARHAQGTRP